MKYYALLPERMRVVCDFCSSNAVYVMAEIRWENEDFACKGCFVERFISLDHTVLKWCSY